MAAANKICLPSGDHLGLVAPYLYLVSCIGSPPFIDKMNICGLLFTVRTKASCFPSALHAGCEAPSFALVNCTGASQPVGDTVYTWVRYL